MAITLRSAKGSELTHDELDANFTTLLDADLDSSNVQSIIEGIVDETYVQARQNDTQRDSSFVTDIVTASYISSNRPAETIFSVSGNGSNYTFTGDGFPDSATNPTLYFTRGKTYEFTNVPAGHPLEIRVDSGGSAYSSGVTNNAGSGTVSMTVPMNAPTSLVYQCTVHAGMVGGIKILDDTDNQRDSAFVTGIVDSAYIQARQADIYRDSAFVTTIVDSDYVQALIDSAYVDDIVEKGSYTSLTATSLTSAGDLTLNPTSNLKINASGFTDTRIPFVTDNNGTLATSSALTFNDIVATMIVDGNLTVNNTLTATLDYSTDSATLWNGTPPTTVDSALDRLALVVRTLNGGTGA
jgi:hypothetical protein